MTPLELLETLKIFVEEETKDLILPVKVSRGSSEKKERAAKVFKQSLPDKDSGTSRIPYVLLQFLKSKDEQPPGNNPDSTCMVRIVVATYSEDGEEGAMSALNLMTRIRLALLKKRVVGGAFTLKLDTPLEAIYYPDDTAPYYLGEMVTNWQMPIIEREVSYD